VAQIDVLAALPKLSSRWGQQGNWPVGVEEVRSLLAAAEEERVGMLADVVHQCLGVLAERIAHHTLASADARREAGELEYHDLLVFARQLLREQRSVRRVLHERFQCLLLDEFQDTDPLQIELAVLIATDVDDLAALGAASGWQDLPVPPGRLFFVGDAKQSIYRFRRADIGLYLDAREAFSAGATTLARNFRSVPGVIDLVNGLFGELFGEGVDRQQPAYATLVAVRPPAGDEPPVWVCGGSSDASAPELREQEAAAIAAAVRQILDEGREVVVDGATRMARPDDIAILLPARTSLAQLEEALVEQRLPYRTETGSLVWAAREVRELFTVLQALDDPSDEVALVGALRSVAFGCGDDELLEYRQAGGRWTYLAAPPEELHADHPVVRGMVALRALHAERAWVDVAGLVERVVRERRLFEVAVADRRPRDTWRRLRYVVDQARAFSESVGGSLRDFLDWADRQRSETTAAAAPVLPEPDDRAVRILTIHGAKGLEFPIAVVSGLTTQPGRARRGARVHFDDDGGPPDVALNKSLTTADFDAVQTIEDQLDVHERLRLLYVALTRARDLLVVSGVHKPGAGAFGELVWQWAEAHPEACVAGPDGLDPELPPDELAPWEAAARAVGVRLPDRDAWLDQRTDLLAAARPAAVAATGIAEAAAGPWLPAVAEERDEGIDPTRPPWARGRGATALGRAVHAVLQNVDLRTGADVADLARAQAAAEGVPDAVAEVEQRVRAALAAPLLAGIADRRHWREVYVAAPIGDVVVEGFVDLLFESDDGLVVVDYKTDAARTAGAVEAAYRRYRLQGAAYALALEEHLGRPVAGVSFLFLTEDGATERAVDDLAAAVAEARAVASGIPPARTAAG
jgi:ATP-dependent exoDNAse (exonuclease V) beta subunit